MNSETRFLLNNLNHAEAALRNNLHTHFLDETARGHMERATSHVREAYIAINEPGRARSVPDLLNDIATGERHIAFAVAKRPNRKNIRTQKRIIHIAGRLVFIGEPIYNVMQLSEAKHRLSIHQLWTHFQLSGKAMKSCRCLWRPDRHPSFSVFHNGTKWKDHGTGEAGDTLDFFHRVSGLSEPDACREFLRMGSGGYSLPNSASPPFSKPHPATPPALSLGAKSHWETLAKTQRSPYWLWNLLSNVDWCNLEFSVVVMLGLS